MQNLQEGQYTSNIYGQIKDQNYEEAIRLLNIQLEVNPKNRAALSLLGYCNYHIQNFLAAAEMYEQLIKYYPEVVEYRIYLAQSLYKAENYIEALKACQNIDKPELAQQVINLQFAIKYQMNELYNAHVLLNNSDPEKEETLISQGCILYKENKFEDAKNKFEEAKKLCDSPFIEYNIGVCCYKLKMLSAACSCFQNILEKAAKNYPEIIVQNRIEGIKAASLANSPALYESCLIEAYNLKAAIDYMLTNFQESKEALNDMPPRDDEELDSVTLHNLSLVNIDKDPDDSFKKLNFLLKKQLCPPEALSNLLILYCKYEQYDLAHDVLSENEELKMKYMTEEEVAYISAIGMLKTNKEVAYDALEKLAKVYRENITKQFKLIKEAKNSSDKAMFNKILQVYDNALQK
jgi:tetratricopeptide repeat protein 30